MKVSSLNLEDCQIQWDGEGTRGFYPSERMRPGSTFLCWLAQNETIEAFLQWRMQYIVCPSLS